MRKRIAKKWIAFILLILSIFASFSLDLKTDTTPYVKQLQQVKRLLAKTPSLVEVVDVLGNEPVALFSVPTAIYCFLRSFGEIDGKQVRLFGGGMRLGDIGFFFQI